MPSQLIYYVYAYLRSKDSKTANAGTPYYIGKGCDYRIDRGHGKTPLPENKANRVKLEQNLTEIGAFAIERRLIQWWGRKDNNTGILLNRTDGGEGPSGWSPTQEMRHKLSLVRKGKTWEEIFGISGAQNKRIQNSLLMRGRSKPPRSAAQRENYSRSKLGKVSPIKGMPSGKKGIPHSDSHRAALCKPKSKLTCPHCNKEGGSNLMKRWHFDNCKYKLQCC
jgi:hypothetical protein